MKKINLQLFDESRAALLRNAIADYAEIDGTYELMGTGFTTLDESPNAQTDSETYINESTASTDITGYETEFSYESRLIPSQKAIYKLWKMGRDHATGTDAQLKYVRVELFNAIYEIIDGYTREAGVRNLERTITSVLRKCAQKIAAGETEKISVSGTLHAVGDPIQGKFDTVSKKFTAGTFAGKYDTPVA